MWGRGWVFAIFGRRFGRGLGISALLAFANFWVFPQMARIECTGIGAEGYKFSRRFRGLKRTQIDAEVCRRFYCLRRICKKKFSVWLCVVSVVLCVINIEIKVSWNIKI